MSLFNKYRPLKLSELKGNKETIESLDLKIQNRSIPHSILLSGPRGCGKTTIARIVANELNCSSIDRKEINCANDTGIEPIRGIIRNMKNKPLDGDNRVFILDEVHRLTSIAQSALLKPLEEPYDHVYFILCTTDPQKLLTTVKSRCTPFIVNPITEKQIIILMKNICRSEKKKVPMEVLGKIALDSLGHSRDALVILEKIIDLNPKQMLSVAEKTASQQNEVIDLCRSLWNKRSWKEITSIINNIKEDPEIVRRSILGYCDSILAKSDNPWAYLIMDSFKDTFFYTGRPGLRIACYEAWIEIKGKK